MSIIKIYVPSLTNYLIKIILITSENWKMKFVYHKTVIKSIVFPIPLYIVNACKKIILVNIQKEFNDASLGTY